jgi:hypothetical protein
MICKKCGVKTYAIKGFHLDSDGIREAQYCDHCKIIWSVGCGGIFVHAIMKTPYAPDELTKLEGFLEDMIERVRLEKEKANES